MIVSSGDAFWLRAETTTTPANWAVAFEIGGAMDGSRMSIDELREQVAARLPTVPWVSWRIRRPRLGLGRPRWLDTPVLPLDELVVHDQVSTGIEERLADLLHYSWTSNLPLWRLRLVDLADGRQFVILHAHHAFGGGHVAIEMLERFFGQEARPANVSSEWPPTRVSRGALVADVGWAAAALMYRALMRLRPSARWAPARSGPPLVGVIGADRVVSTEVLSLERLTAVGRAHRASLTRVLIALLAQAADPFGAGDGSSTPSLRVLFPRGTLKGEVTRPGNTARSSFLDFPLGLAPSGRLIAVREAIGRGSNAPAENAIADLTVSFMPDIDDLWIGDRPLVSMTTAAPLRVCSRPYTRLTIVVQRFRGEVFVTFTADKASLAAAVPLLGQRLQAALSEFEQDALVSR